MASTHYHLRYCMPFIRLVCGDTGLPVLTAILSHANTRNRCYPSYTHLELITGLSRPSISKAIQGLVDLSMIRVLPLEERSQDEQHLDSRLNIYEATGYMQIGELVIPYLNLDFGKLPVKITPMQDFEFEALIFDIQATIKAPETKYQLTTFTDIVNYVYSKEIHQEVKTKKISATIQKTDVAHEYEEISLEAVEAHESKHSLGAWFMVRGVSGQDLTPPIIQEDLPPALRYLRKKSKRPSQVKLIFALDPQSKAVYQYVDALTFYAYFAPIDGTPMRYSWDLAAKERRWDAIKNMWRGAKRSLNTLDVTTLHTLWQRNPSTYAPSKIITALDAMEQENILQAQAQHEQAQFVTVYTDAGAIQLHKEHDAVTIEALRKEGITIHEHAQGKAS